MSGVGGSEKVWRVGTRQSQLAMIQTNGVIKSLKERHPEAEFEVVAMKTMGDKILDTALSKIGEKSLFTKELEAALLDKRVDMVVHSLKDLPTILPEGLIVGAVCKRDDPRDAMVMHPNHKKESLDTLPPGSVIGTSSLRRGAQLRKKYPHFIIKDIRGNLNTRLRKLDEAEDYHAIVLATAGLERMNWQSRIDHILEPDLCMYAVSQGAIAVECCSHDNTTLELLAKLHDDETVLRVVAERTFLRTLEGGCSVPVAVHTEIKDGELFLEGGVWSIEGDQEVVDKLSVKLPDAQQPASKLSPRPNGPRMFGAIVAEHMCQAALAACEQVGVQLAEKLIAAGAGAILRVAKEITATEIMKKAAEKDAAATLQGAAQVVPNGTAK